MFATLQPPPAVLPRPPSLVARAPMKCRPYVERVSEAKPTCDTRAELLSALDAAVSVRDPDSRDASLVALESCGGAPSGLIRALRADLAPVTCADVMVEPLLTNRRAKVSGEIQHVLVGLAVAARQSRLPWAPPAMKPPIDREHLRG